MYSVIILLFFIIYNSKLIFIKKLLRNATEKLSIKSSEKIIIAFYLTKKMIKCLTMNIVKIKTQIKNYLVKSKEYEDEHFRLYLVEDLLTNREFLLYQCVIEKKSIYRLLSTISHPSILKIYKSFEYEEDLFFVTQRVDKSTPKELFSEEELNKILKELVTLSIALKKVDLSLGECSVEDFTFSKEGSGVLLHNLTRITNYKDDAQSIFLTATIIYRLATQNEYAEGFSKESISRYSNSFIILLERMLGVEGAKAIESLEVLNGLVKVKKSEALSCEPLVCQKDKEGSLSKSFALVSVLLIIAAVFYVSFMSTKELNLKNLSAVDTARYFLSAHLDNEDAQYALARVYEEGSSFVSKDKEEALKWYKRAASQGYLAAQERLAYLYYKGELFGKDISNAILYYKEAAESGSSSAAYSLGRIYMTSEYEDNKSAIFWLSRAVEAGEIDAAYPLGYIYLNRAKRGDYKKAINYFRKDSNSSYSQMALGYMYSRGYGVKKDIKKAIEFYEKSAAKGHTIAAVNLANIYTYNEEYRDKKKARYWYKKAADAGNEFAKRKLDALEALFKKYKREEMKKRRKRASFSHPIHYGHLIDLGDIVKDKFTGLLWQKDGRVSKRLNFYQAQAYARQLRLGGMSGWRVPTIEELDSIYPALEAPFKNTSYGRGSAYWSSEVDERLSDYAFLYQWEAEHAGANNGYASKNYVYVRCVHD